MAYLAPMAEVVIGVLIILVALGVGLTLRYIGNKWDQPMLRTFGLVVILIAIIVVVSLVVLRFV